MLSPEDRQHIEHAGVFPIEDGAFVVLRADLYELVRSLIEGDELTIDVQRRWLSELGKSAGWDDPTMDVSSDL